MNRRALAILLAYAGIAGCSTAVTVVPRDDSAPVEHGGCAPILLQPEQIPAREIIPIADISVHQGSSEWFCDLEGALSRLDAELRKVGADAYRFTRVQAPGFWHDCWRLDAVAYRFAPAWERLALDEPAARAALDSLGAAADPITGIWHCAGAVSRTAADSAYPREHLLPEYRLAILPSDHAPDYEYAAYVLESTWSTCAPGDVKAHIRRTSVPRCYEFRWYDEGYLGAEITVELADESLIVFTSETADGMRGEIANRRHICLERDRPAGSVSAAPAGATGIRRQCTGVLVREDGYVATSGIDDGTELAVGFPESDHWYRASIAIRDTSTGTVLLHLDDFAYEDVFSGPLPYRLSNTVEAGKLVEARVMGYPVSPLLGTQLYEPFTAKVGAACTTFALVSTDRPVPPGFLGAPIVTAGGELVGIVIVTHDEPWAFTRFWQSTFFGGGLYWTGGIDVVNTLLAQIPAGPTAAIPTVEGPRNAPDGDLSRAVLPYTALVSVAWPAAGPTRTGEADENGSDH